MDKNWIGLAQELEASVKTELGVLKGMADGLSAELDDVERQMAPLKRLLESLKLLHAEPVKSAERAAAQVDAPFIMVPDPCTTANDERVGEPSGKAKAFFDKMVVELKGALLESKPACFPG